MTARMASKLPAPELARVLESAARLQQLVPDAVLVGGSAAAWHAGHRISFDHDHVLIDLNQRFDAVLEALDADPRFVLNRAAHGKIIPGELGGIETGIRQLIRTVPLETENITLPSGLRLVVPTIAEALRIKAYLALKRNQTRDVSVTRRLRTYKGIRPPWDSWANVRAVLASVAAAMIGRERA